MPKQPCKNNCYIRSCRLQRFERVAVKEVNSGGAIFNTIYIYIHPTP